MGLTVTEKEHFKKRIDERVEEMSAQIRASDIAWERELREQAVKTVEEHFGVQGDLAELALLRQAREDINAQVHAKERDIISKMSGLRIDDVGDSSSTHYRNNTATEFYTRYPGDSAKWMERHCKYFLKRLIASHPTGARLAKLQDLRMDFQDSIATAGTHAQLATVWNEVKQKLDIFEEGDTRQPRKVNTSRARTAKGQTAE